VDVWQRTSATETVDAFQAVSVVDAGSQGKKRSILRQAVWLQYGGVTSVEFRSYGALIAAAFQNGTLGFYSTDGAGYLIDAKIDAVATGVSLLPSARARHRKTRSVRAHRCAGGRD
jgi:hypothetical protein